MLHLIGSLGADGCSYKSVEFYGEPSTTLSVSERMTMTNLAMEMGVKCAFVPPDAKTREYLASRLKDQSLRGTPCRRRTPSTAKNCNVDVSKLEPMVACPHEVENTKPIGEVAGHAHRPGVSGILRQRQIRRPGSRGAHSERPAHSSRCPIHHHAGLERNHAGSHADRSSGDAGRKRRHADQSRLRRLRGRRRDPGRRRSLPFHRESKFPRPHGQQQGLYLSVQSGDAGRVGDQRRDLRSAENL